MYKVDSNNKKMYKVDSNNTKIYKVIIAIKQVWNINTHTNKIHKYKMDALNLLKYYRKIGRHWFKYSEAL